jgi:hypothetical protein
VFGRKGSYGFASPSFKKGLIRGTVAVALLAAALALGLGWEGLAARLRVASGGAADLVSDTVGQVGPEDIGFPRRPLPATAPAGLKRLVAGATEQTRYTKTYDPSYVEIPYPGGDVPLDRGVCTDVVIRAFRKAGIDLQVEVHEDMASHFDAYPDKWGHTRPDPNIDHRRVPNLQTYFTRKGKAVTVTTKASGYRPGDIVTWKVFTRPHVGMVSDYYNPVTKRYLVVHNIGSGARIEDVLFSWEITGHYRWF